VRDERKFNVSWRRKYFYDYASWDRYRFLCSFFCSINQYLKEDYIVTDHKGKLIHEDFRFVFTKDRQPFLGLNHKDKYVTYFPLKYETKPYYVNRHYRECKKIKIKKTKKELLEQFKGFRKKKRGSKATKIYYNEI
jgi:hypothetical protein